VSVTEDVRFDDHDVADSPLCREASAVDFGPDTFDRDPALGGAQQGDIGPGGRENLVGLRQWFLIVRLPVQHSLSRSLIPADLVDVPATIFAQTSTPAMQCCAPPVSFSWAINKE
jgi:hypothetical protein